jgi:hypothetical protein
MSHEGESDIGEEKGFKIAKLSHGRWIPEK